MRTACLAFLLAATLAPLPAKAADERERIDDAWLLTNLRFAVKRSRSELRADRTIGVYIDEGVFPPSAQAVIRRLDEAKTPPLLLLADDFTPEGLKGLKRIIVPGGWAPSILAGLGDHGQKALVRFVEQGGAYLGICAGAYVPCSKVRWEGETIPYPLGLVQGTAAGPVKGRAPWPTAETFDLQLDKKKRSRALYAGGASFEVKDAKVLARYPGGGAAAIEIKRRKGRLILTGAHVEFRTDKDADLLGQNNWAAGLKPGDARLFTAWFGRLTPAR